MVMRKTNERKELDRLIDKLKETVKEHRYDNETVHGRFDDVLRHIATMYESSLYEEMEELVGDIAFWYA